MGDDDRVIVHVDHPRPGVDLAHDLVHGTLCGQPDADVEELADAGFGRQEPNDPAQEAPILHRRPAQPGHQREHPLRSDPVRLEVVLAAQILIIYWAGNHTLRTRARLCDVSLIGFGAGRTIAWSAIRSRIEPFLDQAAPLRGAGSGAPRAGFSLGRPARCARAVPAAEHHGLTGLFVTPVAGLVLP